MYVLWLKVKISIPNNRLSMQKRLEEAGKALWCLEHMGEFVCKNCTNETPVYLQTYLTKLQEEFEEKCNSFAEPVSLDIKPNSNDSDSVGTTYALSISSHSHSKNSDHQTVKSFMSSESEDGKMAHPTSAGSSASLNTETVTTGNKSMGATREYVTQEAVKRSLSKKKQLSRKHETGVAWGCHSVSQITDLSWETISSRSHESDEN